MTICTFIISTLTLQTTHTTNSLQSHHHAVNARSLYLEWRITSTNRFTVCLYCQQPVNIYN